ncbi:Slam-dependent surface lipoprotein [Conchiformibius kuhniae]|uniref:Slam-dependent surface lipoprotein n=1 Tax=Conchiformibius kuhniae TaxID=211502 RepID=A0A8T9MVU5_9NEIS|nr:Slam-dependent surface lipoprotein [Conchiformibius kuhniae]
MKVICAAVAAVFLLGGCLGSNLGEPVSPVPIPLLEPVRDNPPVDAEAAPRMQTLRTAGNVGGTVETVRTTRNVNGLSITEPELVYRHRDGTVYRFNAFSDPIVPSYGSPSWQFITKQPGQDSRHGKLFACCTRSAQFGYAPATKLQHVRFGAWQKNGMAELFVGGKTADAALMPGGSHDAVRNTKGKATYEVWALRVKDGAFVTSSYTPKALGFNNKGEPVLSLFTANFNTGKLGGTIIGNQDFGADVVLQDVDIHGNAFSGTAQSGGRQGLVDGRFFGEPRTYGDGENKRITGPATDEIGGKIVFDGHRHLDTVFGGKRTNEQYNDTSTDLTPLNP